MSMLRIRIFVLLERLKKITAVADELGLKQPTVSFHLRKLEEEWGAPLFEIKTGKVLLTEAGKLLHRYAEQIDRIYMEAQTRMEAMKDGRQRFVIGSTEAAAQALLSPGWFAAMSEDGHPPRLELLTGDAHMLVERLSEGSIDLMLGAPAPETPSFIVESLLTDGLALVLAAAHPLAAVGMPASFQLPHYPAVMLNDSALSAALIDWEAAERIKLTVRLTADSPQAVLTAVSSGAYFSILPLSLAAAAPERCAVIPLQGDSAPWKLSASWRADHHNPQLAARIAEKLKRMLPR